MTVKISTKVLIAVIFCLIIGSGFVFAQGYDSNTERIISFRSQIKVHSDSSMTVTETILVNSTGEQIKHGIYRDFPTRYKDNLGNNYVVGFEVLEAERDGAPESHHFQKMDNGQRVYLGKEDVLLPAGEHTYTLVYKTNRQLGFFKDYDELYWNVTGNGWSFPIDSATATVELPEGATERIIAIDAYTGPMGAQGKNFFTGKDSSGNLMIWTTRSLYPGEGFTIVVGWPKGFVKEPTSLMKAGYLIRDSLGTFFGLVALLALLAYYLIVWLRFGRDPAKGTIIAQYEPPPGFSPAAIRYLVKRGYDDKVVSAAIINMAVKGFLKIKEKKNSYILEKTVAQGVAPSPEEALIAERFFSAKDEIDLSLSANGQKVQTAVSFVRRLLKKEIEGRYFLGNRRYFKVGVFLSAITIFASVAIGALQKGNAMNAMSVIFMSVWVSGWTFAVFTLLFQNFSLWKSVILGKNYSSIGKAMFTTIFALPFLLAEVAGIWFLISLSSASLVFLILALALLNIIFYKALKKFTDEGRKVMDELEGFKLYLTVVEKERLKFFNPPQETPELFEKYLPYAIALGVEKAWAEKFSEILRNTGEEENYSPSWYDGHRWRDLSTGTLAMGAFAAGLSSSFSHTISSSSVVPGSRSGFGGGGGGGGGGGSSGGGGGGGGGGGW